MPRKSERLLNISYTFRISESKSFLIIRCYEYRGHNAYLIGKVRVKKSEAHLINEFKNALQSKKEDIVKYMNAFSKDKGLSFFKNGKSHNK
jgi:hypothetical protein